ncbi:MGMT family protein [Streptococcus massiliensis]|uniref:Predicted methylated DNA-protein cysteine methyltransferase n=2 Tax=Streptococcus massiliensis TaxID=313439 RepID=A0A380KZ42_9STRE|nr:MGMT family protein [Streptococcus massiliensis]SUN75820.1 Predicted methylated DNA-protein cysteine methyltransferase [Streptococcus massiliensis]
MSSQNQKRTAFLAPDDYKDLLARIPAGKVATLASLREYMTAERGIHFTNPFETGVGVLVLAWKDDDLPYWRVLKAGGELNGKYPGGLSAQKEKLESEGLPVIAKGQRLFVKDYEEYLVDFSDSGK